MADEPQKPDVPEGPWVPPGKRGALQQLLLERMQKQREAQAQAEQQKELQQAFVEAAIEWLQARWGEGRKCPYCEVSRWEVGTPLDISVAGGEFMSPHFPVMCANCGNTVLINAIRAGLLPAAEDEA